MSRAARLRREAAAFLALGLAIAAVASIALSIGGDGAAKIGAAPQSASAAATKAITINIKDFAYSKKTVTINKGQSVKWVNKDDMRHNATTSKKGGPHGPLLDQGESYTWKATRSGTFAYHCKPHPFMKGTIVVRQ